jgi:transposase
VAMPATRSAQELENRRRLAVARVNDGYSQTDVARFLGVNVRSVRTWVARYRDEGEPGLAASTAPGNGSMHKGDPVRAVLRAFPRLTPERLPPYAPDLNPVEWLWSYLKYGEMANFAPKDAAHLDAVVTGHLEAIRRQPQRMKGFYDGAKIPLLDRVQPT